MWQVLTAVRMGTHIYIRTDEVEENVALSLSECDQIKDTEFCNRSGGGKSFESLLDPLRYWKA